MVVDSQGKSLSLVAEIQGFQNFRESHIRGVILNRISPSMYPRLKEMIEEQTGLLVYGYLPEKKGLQVESRYLGLRLPERWKR